MISLDPSSAYVNGICEWNLRRPILSSPGFVECQNAAENDPPTTLR